MECAVCGGEVEPIHRGSGVCASCANLLGEMGPSGLEALSRQQKRYDAHKALVEKLKAVNHRQAEDVSQLDGKVRELELQVSELQKKLAKEEEDHGRTIDERDAFEETITKLAEDAGCEEEWSNLHAHGDCITNLWDAKVKEKQTEKRMCDDCGTTECTDFGAAILCPNCYDKRLGR